GLEIGSLPWREDPADLLLIHPDSYDPEGEHFPIRRDACVGTGSVRRQLQLIERRPDLTIGDLRGNVNTRISKLVEGRFDAIVLAAAGIARLGLTLEGLRVHRLDPSEFIPAPAQGVVAVQMRESDSEVRHYLETIHDPEVSVAAEVERNFLALVEGGCNLPIGAWAEPLESGEMCLHVMVGQKGWAPGDPIDVERATVVGSDPEALAWTALQLIRDRRGGEVWSAPVAAEATRPERVLVTATDKVGQSQSKAIRAAGFGVVHVPMIETHATVTVETLQEVAGKLHDGDWLVFTSSAGVRHFLERISGAMLPKELRVAAIGKHTAETAGSFGLTIDFIPTVANSEGFVAEFSHCRDGASRERFILPMARGGRRLIADALKAQGHVVLDLPVYESRPASGDAVDAALSVDYDCIVFSSPSAVSVFHDLGGSWGKRNLAIGATTRRALDDLNVQGVEVPTEPSAAAIVDLLQHV
ncbi:MAG: hypothetical protein CME01_00005, partial [Geminicoccus sp.]|nr:hypothetical protein [Geminicoccus sp.]